jgi:hypothetical protein
MPTALYKSKIPVIFRDLNEGWMRGTPDVAPSTGAVPRDFSIDPVEMRDSPDSIKTIPQSDWDAAFEKGEEAEDSLEHLYLRGDKPAFELLDQDGFPDCWYHSTAHAVMMDQVKQNLTPVVRLNAVAGATLLGRTRGAWCGLSMKDARDNGIPPICAEAPYQSRNVKNNAALQAKRKLHRDLEDWYDMAKAEYDQDLSRDQLATCLFNNLPCPSDYNRFAHSMLSIRWVRIEKGLWGPLTLNSWQGFGYHGLCVLAGMVPDGSCALRSSTPSVAA